MIKKIFLLLLFITLIISCKNNRLTETETLKNSTSVTKVFSDSVVIAPIYPDSVFFVVQAELEDITKVKGKIKKFHNRAKHTHELYFQRFVEKQGTLSCNTCIWNQHRNN